MRIRQSKKYKFKEIAKKCKFWIKKTHLLKLVDKMCKYEKDLASIVEDTERTRFCPKTDGLKMRQKFKFSNYFRNTTLLGAKPSSEPPLAYCQLDP